VRDWQSLSAAALFISHNPSVYSLKLVATSPFRGDITVCVVLTIAVIANFYMLPERELASPKAMTEGCATKLFISD
jgi:hypothetical protein